MCGMPLSRISPVPVGRGDDPLTVEIGLSQHARVEFQHFLELTKLLGKTRLLRGGTESRLRCVFFRAR